MKADAINWEMAGREHPAPQASCKKASKCIERLEETGSDKREAVIKLNRSELSATLCWRAFRNKKLKWLAENKI